MKKILLSLACIPSFVFAQQTNETMLHAGQTREYIQYVPSSYDGSTPVPVIFSLHGLGDNKENFSNVGFHAIAEQNNVIVITPEALVDPMMNATAWNSGAGVGGFVLNANVDDVGFISAMIDKLHSSFNIDLSRVYATGFSMGGFMSNRLACELNNRIAAIASVAGTIGNGVQCNPGRAVPVCHFHGTADGTVAYEGNMYGNDAEALFDFWANNNSCESSRDSVSFEDTANDNITVMQVRRNNACAEGAETMLYKAEGAEHTWLFTPTNDIDYTTEIWQFFSNQSHPDPTSSVVEINNSIHFSVYPNPTNDLVTISLNQASYDAVMISVVDITGKQILTTSAVSTNDITLDVTDLESGAYMIQVVNQQFVASKSFIKE